MTNGVKRIARLIKQDKNGTRRVDIMRGLSVEFLRDVGVELGIPDEALNGATDHRSMIQVILTGLSILELIKTFK